MSDDLKDDWLALGVGRRGRKGSVPPRPVPAPSKEDALRWLRELGDSHVLELGYGDDHLLTVPGPNPQTRGGFYKELDEGKWVLDHTDSRAWLHDSPLENWMARAARLPAAGGKRQTGDWAWLRALAEVEDLYIEDPLRSLADLSVSVIHDAMLVLFSLRFCVLEKRTDQEFEQNLQRLIRWMTAAPEPGDAGQLSSGMMRRMVLDPKARIEVLLFFLTLAIDNETLDKTVFVWDEIEGACSPSGKERIRELHLMTSALRRWCPRHRSQLGFILGFDPAWTPALRRTNLSFAQDVLLGMRWVDGVKKGHGAENQEGQEVPFDFEQAARDEMAAYERAAREEAERRGR